MRMKWSKGFMPEETGSGTASGIPKRRRSPAPKWWSRPWDAGSPEDPDVGWEQVSPEPAWHEPRNRDSNGDLAILDSLDFEFEQVRSRERVRDLAEVFTNKREVDSILDLMKDAFAVLDVKFLEPSCGSGNFLVEILRRKLVLVSKKDCLNQEQYEHRLLRSIASIYGVDISHENVTEARSRLAHSLLHHFQIDANTVEPSTGFLNAANLILSCNIVVGDTLNNPYGIELCDWRPRASGCFERVWSYALVPEDERGLFWEERKQDTAPVHYSDLKPPESKTGQKKQKKIRS